MKREIEGGGCIYRQCVVILEREREEIGGGIV